MKKLLFTGAFVLGSIFSINAMAQMSEEDAAAAVKRRQSVFQVLSFSNGPLGAMARGGEYNAEAAMLACKKSRRDIMGSILLKSFHIPKTECL